MFVWIVKRSTLLGWCDRHPSATPALRNWLKVAQQGRWANVADVRRDFPQADPVPVKSGGPVYVFNIGGFRLATAIHFDAGRVYLLRFMTHAEYDKGHAKRTDGKPGRWRDEL